ncbi:MAG: hypothetical protein A4E20_16135 [Nitrospira sp. SG-bin2]|nr:MAG: hypothetical protein A4E20_16135 [Nitrospira sp. SG-bin2]
MRAYRPTQRTPARRVDGFRGIYQPKTACQRKPAAPLTLGQTERWQGVIFRISIDYSLTWLEL